MKDSSVSSEVLVMIIRYKIPLVGIGLIKDIGALNVS